MIGWTILEIFAFLGLNRAKSAILNMTSFPSICIFLCRVFFNAKFSLWLFQICTVWFKKKARMQILTSKCAFSYRVKNDSWFRMRKFRLFFTYDKDFDRYFILQEIFKFLYNRLEVLKCLVNYAGIFHLL